MGRLPEAWVAPPQVRALREQVRHRCKLVAIRSGFKAQVHAVLAKQGVQVAMSDLFGVDGTRLPDELALEAPYPGSGALAAPRHRRALPGVGPALVDLPRQIFALVRLGAIVSRSVLVRAATPYGRHRARPRTGRAGTPVLDIATSAPVRACCFLSFACDTLV
jgi:hypothetical protein